jgi:hypothetical protein
MTATWRAILKHWRSVPGWAASHLDWLAQTIEKCLDADDPLLNETIDAILSEMAANIGLLSGLRIAYTQRFVGELTRHGLRAAEAGAPAMETPIYEKK